MKEAPYRRMAQLADAVAEGLIEDLPASYAFFGYSMGAILAFEVARRLDKQGLSARAVVVGAARPPQLGRRTDAPPTYNLPDAALIETLQELRGTPPEVLLSAETMQIVLPGIRADLEVVETYQYSPDRPLSCPLMAIGGSDDVRVGSQELEHWREQTTGEFSFHVLPGSHFFLLESWNTVQNIVFSYLHDKLTR